MLLASGIITAYTWATAYEFWRGRSEALVSRWPAIFMLFAHGSLYLLRTPFGAMLPWSPTGNEVFESVWMTVLSFEALLFTISIAFILLAMAKERTEHRHKTAALVDPLTGIANRRAFLQDGEAQLKRQATDPRPIAVMLLDLDNFKSINDRFGHAIGDRVLQRFAEVASSCMRRADLFGRLGGEEFAAVLSMRRGSGRWRSPSKSAARSPTRPTRSTAGRWWPRCRSASSSATTPFSIFRRCWRRPITRSIAPRTMAATAIEVASIELILDRAKRVGGDTPSGARPCGVREPRRNAAFRLLHFRRRRRSGPFADDEQNRIFGFGAVEMHLLTEMGHEGTGRHRHGAVRIEFGAGADPPCSFQHGDETVVRMEVGDGSK